MLRWIYTWDWYAINLCAFISSGPVSFVLGVAMEPRGGRSDGRPGVEVSGEGAGRTSPRAGGWNRTRSSCRSLGCREYSLSNHELRVSERSSDSGQTVQRGPWEQKWLESTVFELTTRITKLMNGLRFRKSFMVIKWWYPTYSIMALPWSCRVRVSVEAELLSRNRLWRLEPFSLLAPEGEEKIYGLRKLW